MSYYYKVRNDLSVASLTKIINELERITGVDVHIIVMGINDVRLELLKFNPPLSKGEMEDIRAALTDYPPHYLKTLEWEK